MRLSDEGRMKALIFYNALIYSKEKLSDGVSIDLINKEIKNLFKEKNVELEYFKVVESDSFKERNSIEESGTFAICIAGYLEGVRLIDNMLLN
jgi:pantoate--beta-alanine ligase